MPYEDNFLDLDPNYRDHWGRPLLRLTFDWHDNERNMWRFIAKRAQEIMTAMNPTKIVDFTPELPAYNIEKYQSTHPTGGCIMGEDPSTRSRTATARSGTRRTSSSPAPRSCRRTQERTRPAPSPRSPIAQPKRSATDTSNTQANCSNSRRRVLFPRVRSGRRPNWFHSRSSQGMRVPAMRTRSDS